MEHVVITEYVLLYNPLGNYNVDEHNQLIDWMNSQIGTSQVDWKLTYDNKEANWYFVREEDKVKFILRWC